jgi:hypothetical protein
MEQLVELRLAQENEKLCEQTCPSAILSTTNPIYYDLVSILGRRNGKPTTNHLGYGMEMTYFLARKIAIPRDTIGVTPHTMKRHPG